MRIQQYYSAIIRRGTLNVPTFREVRQDLAKNAIDPHYFVHF